MPSSKKTFVVERLDQHGNLEKTEVEANRAEQEENSTRVTFYQGDDAVASFINIQGWYPKS